MMMLIPISVMVPGKGQRFFPRALRGKLLPESEATKVWERVLAEKGAVKAPSQPTTPSAPTAPARNVTPRRRKP